MREYRLMKENERLRMQAAEARGESRGLEKGRAEGIAEGRAEAEAKAHEEKLASALAIYKSGSMPLEQIASIMKLDAVELAEYAGR